MTLWLGSHASFLDYQAREAKLDAAIAAGTAAPEKRDGYQVYGNVAVVDISGPLTNRESFFTWMMGITSYGELRNNLISAVTDPQVKELVLNVDSPGGAASGCFDTSQLINTIASRIPVTTFVSGNMASAALMLGLRANRVYASPMSVIGSLGVMTTLRDYTGMMEKEGIKTTVLRTGDKKALGGPDEPLTDEARATIQAQIDDLNEVFISSVAESRNLSVDYVRNNLADGSEYVGEKAMEVGLIDGLTTFDTLIGGLQSNIDAKANRSQNRYTAESTDPASLSLSPQKELDMKKKLLTQKELALLAEGVDPKVALQGDAEATDPPADPEPPVETPPEPPAEPEAGTPVEGVVSSAPDLVSYLRAELAAKSTELTQMAVKLADQERELNSLKSTHGGLVEAVAERTSMMQIGLYGKAPDLSTLNPEALLALHAQTRTEFQKTYPVGGVAQAADPTESTLHTPPTPMARAGLRAVKTN